ncbi:DUF5723 family protein [Maribacter sp. X9]|uniref:DUF5723 family protein n=1 Tax=Maribacter sp. X9 TaxID=3402159 RepID=UPI003AF3B764
MCSILFASLGIAQNKEVLYDFNEIPQSLLLNPGIETDFKWYVGVPMLSGISGYAGSNGISVNDIFADDGIDINVKVRERALAVLKPKDEFSTTAQLEYFNGGFKLENPNVFYSFGGYFEVDNITYWPQDYASLIFDGNADQLNRKFDLSDLNSSGSLVNVMHFGVNKMVNRNLTLGIRGKLYSGILDYRSTHNKGYLVNTQGQNNTIATTLDADMVLHTSGIEALDDANDSGSTSNALVKRALLGGDLGLGLDVGFTYHLSERTTLTGSILDLGFMYHTNDAKNYTLKGRETVEGIEIDVVEDFANLNRDFWQDLVDDVERLIPFDTDTHSYLSLRPTKIYGSIRHDFGQAIGGGKSGFQCDCTVGSSKAGELRSAYRNSIGAQFYAINRPRGPQAALTAFYTRRVGNILAIKTTYTVDKFSYSNVGLGMNVQAGPINFYLMADNLLSYQNIAASNYASFQLGLNIISWGRKK